MRFSHIQSFKTLSNWLLAQNRRVIVFFRSSKKIPNSAHLAKLDLALISFEGPNENQLGHLLDFLLTTKSLTTLQITLRKFAKSNSVNTFIERLKECSELSSMTLQFDDCSCVDNSLLMSITRSLNDLPKFANLAISCRLRSLSSTALQYTNSEIKSFFSSISELKNLEEFDFSFQGSLELVINRKFVALCMSLKNLNQLRKLSLQIYNSKGLLIFQLNG